MTFQLVACKNGLMLVGPSESESLVLVSRYAPGAKSHLNPLELPMEVLEAWSNDGNRGPEFTEAPEVRQNSLKSAFVEGLSSLLPKMVVHALAHGLHYIV